MLIIIDTLRADKLGSYGFALDTSPELDRLASRGVRFERVIAQCSWTRPSIGSMITGIYPRTLGLYQGREEVLDQSFDTLAELLRASGYATIGITANPQIAGRNGFDQGFDVFVDRLRALPVRPPRELPIPPWSGTGPRPRLTPFNRMPSAAVFDSALELVDRVTSAPTFLMLNVMEVHGKGPEVRPEFADLFDDHPDGEYLRSVRQISHDVGRFVDRLLERPGFESTLVVIASDHGEGLRDHPGIKDGHRHGFLLYESQVRVPLIVIHSKPALQAAVVRTQVRDMDILPTVLDFLGIEIPTEIDGRTLLPLLDDPAVDVGLPSRFVTETYRPKAAKIAVYASDWKYFENRDDWPLLGARELQAMGQREVGLFTDRIDLAPEAAWELEEYLEQWERDHPKADPVFGERRMSADLKQRLESLGYLDDSPAQEP
ncbi:MAG: sulfatase [Deltaproteobacteria bacterium]|nr:sulfatase [Deltaproteobacteria bacterium]